VSGRSTSDLLTRDSSLDFKKTSKKTHGFSIHTRWIPEKPPHGQWHTNFSYQFTDSFRAGVDYRPLTGDVSILANWRVFSEDDTWRPALILGTSNDDFDDVNSQAYYATLSKHIGTIKKTHFSLYGGATYIEALNEIRPVGGLYLSQGPWSGLLMYSGVDEHVSISRKLGKHTLTFLMFDLKLPGLAYSYQF